MRIGISTSVIQRGKTGIAQYLFALLKSFEKYACDHEFFLFVFEEDQQFFEAQKHTMTLDIVQEKYRPAVRNILWHQKHAPQRARELKLDAILVPSYRRQIWNAPCAKVSVIHDLAPFHVRGKYDLARMFYGRVVVRWITHRQEQVIAVSQNTAHDIERFFKLPKDKISVVWNGIDQERFRLASDNEDPAALVRNKYGLEKPFALYVARLEHPGKNHVRLIEAFEKFKRETGSDRLLVLGGSDWHGAEAIHEAISRSAFKDSIRSLGFVPDEDLPSLYQAADIFLYPSLFEGFGFPPVEAMACGTPVICSDKGSLGEVVGDAAHIIDPVSIDSMKKALVEFDQSSEIRGTFRELGIKRAQLFSWETTARKTLELIHHAVQVRSGRKSVDPD